MEKSSEPDDFTGEFYQTFKKELMSVFLKIIQITEEDGTCSNSINEANITLI